MTRSSTLIFVLQVFVGENKDWKLGVISESAQRKGLFDMSPSNGYYALWWSGNQLRALTAPPLTKVCSDPQLLLHLSAASEKLVREKFIQNQIHVSALTSERESDKNTRLT